MRSFIDTKIEPGCDEILSEDLNDGQDYCGVVAHNPQVCARFSVSTKRRNMV